MPNNDRTAIIDRREKVYSLILRGKRGHEIAKELKVNKSTISRDMQHFVSQSQNYLNDMAKQVIPYVYQTSIESVRDVLKECWNIYSANPAEPGNEGINWNHKLLALKLAKECSEGIFKLTYEAPMVIFANSMGDKIDQLKKGILLSQEQMKEIKYAPGIEYQQPANGSYKTYDT